jgi:UPF0716 protein FxsA
VLPGLAALFVLVQIVEIWLLIQVGQAIGGWQTLALLVLDSLAGAALLRHEGRRAWRAFRQALEERRMPGLEAADGALVIVGGTLLITPGFLSDVVGVLCLLPPTRAVLRRLVLGRVLKRFGLSAGPPRGPQPGASAYRRAEVIEGEVVDEPGTHEGPTSGGGRP